VAARYRASNDQAEVGGDFFDAFQADEAGTVVVIGDVQGHSLEAAVVMAELRYSLRAYVFVGLSPEEVLARTNEVLLRGHPELTATLCMLVFPAGTQSMLVANAGHIPPLVVRDGVATYLEHGGTMLGIDQPQEKPSEVPLEAGTRILLMTDGLVERRSEDMARAMERLARSVEESSTVPPEQLCDQLMEKWGGGEDDVALIVLDVTPR
jgi:serine phosphatase RsbU (regulator of sigma subunit)